MNVVTQGLGRLLSLAGTYSGSTIATSNLTSADIRYGFLFNCPSTANLTDIWVTVGSYSGTRVSSPGTINYGIYEGLSANYLPAGDLIYSATITLNGNTGILRTTGLTHALTAGKLYFLAFWDATGNGSNYVTMNRSLVNPLSQTFFSQTSITTDAWTSAATGTSCPMVSLKIGDNILAGAVTQAAQSCTNNTNERGIRFTPSFNSTLCGIVCSNSDVFAGTHSWKLYAGTTAPGGTPLASWTNGGSSLGTASAPVPTSRLLSPTYDLIKNTEYILAFAPSANSTLPQKAALQSTIDATLLAVVKPFGTTGYYYIEQDGAAWGANQEVLWNASPLLYPVAESGSSVQAATPFSSARIR